MTTDTQTHTDADEVCALRAFLKRYITTLGWDALPADSMIGREAAAILRGESAVSIAEEHAKFRASLGLDRPYRYVEPPEHPDEVAMRELRAEFATCRGKCGCEDCEEAGEDEED